jgi:hypothetical protein
LEDQLIYRQAKAKAQFTLKKTEKEHWQNYCSTINSSTKLSSVWQVTKKMSGVRSAERMTAIKHGKKT